jgi:hypothetical protein
MTTDNKIFVASTEFFLNCPTHDGGHSSSMEVFRNIETIKVWTLSMLNEKHITDLILIENGEKSEQEYSISYQASGHRYVGIIINKGNDKFCRTIDNGSGTLIWENNAE